MANSQFRTDYVQAPSGLLIPPAFKKSAELQDAATQKEMNRRFFAADAKTAKYFTNFGAMSFGSAAGSLEKPRDTVGFAGLRASYDHSAIDKMIIMARLHQMRYVSERALIPEKETGWRVMHKRSADPNWENSPDIERRCREMEEVILRVNTNVIPGGFRAFLQMGVVDELVYDRKVMIIARDMDGLPAAYWTCDPVTVKPRLEVLAPWMVRNNVKSQSEAAMRMSYELQHKGVKDGNGKDIDLTTAAYVQELEGQICGAWTARECNVNITNPENRIDHYFYGKSVFEQSMEWTSAFMAAFTYNADWFRSKIPENLLFMAGDVDPEGYLAFQQQLYGQPSTGTRDHRLAIATGDKDFKAQVVPLRASMQEMAFPAWIRLLLAGKCAFYRMDPRIINFDVASGNDTQMWKTSDRETQLTAAEEQGFHTLIKNEEAWINECIVEPRYDDLVMRWVGLDRPSQMDMAQLNEAKASHYTYNEMRKESGQLRELHVVGYPELGDYPMNPSAIAAMQYIDQKRMVAQQMEQEQLGQQYGHAGGQGMQPASPDTEGQTGGEPGADSPQASGGDALRQAGAAADSPMQKSRTKHYQITIDTGINHGL